MVTARTLALKLEFHLFKKDGALLRGIVPPRTQSQLRRRIRAEYLIWGARKYNAWIAARLAERRARYSTAIEPGLLSVITPVWDGTPLKYFRSLADSLIRQNAAGAAEWVVLNNGCRKLEILAYLNALKRHPWISVHDSPRNTGIIGGLGMCLERATGRFILPVDADDWVYPDCLRVVSWWLRHKGYPPLLYSDEDKVIGRHAVQPYLKPDFDPVLLLNSAYIAHLGVIDRKLALALGAYADKDTEGSPDWDVFLRFLLAGHQAAHIPEIVYSWRMHPESTSDDAGSKPYIHTSQRAVLQRYLDGSGLARKYSIEYSPLLKGGADWWLQRRQTDPWPAVLISLKNGSPPVPQHIDYPGIARLTLPCDAPISALAETLSAPFALGDGMICLLSDDLQIDRADWLWDALGLLERHPDAGMVGGHIRNGVGETVSAGCVLGFGGVCGCPDRGRPAVDPGYFTQVLKQRSVSAVSSQFAVLRASFARELLASGLPQISSIPFLGAWAGAYALRHGKRIVYSPYLSGATNREWDALPKPEEIATFKKTHADILPDCRYYPRAFGLDASHAYQLNGQ